MSEPASPGTPSLPLRVIRSVAARWRDALTVRRYRGLAQELSVAARGVTDEGALFDLVTAIPEFRPAQIRSEFTELMRRVRALTPTAILEVGTATGGTSFLLSRMMPAGGRLLTMDIVDNSARRAAVSEFSRPSVEVIAVRANSQDPAVLDTVRSRLRVTTVPFVFIDGDHSYDGVSADFRIHSSLVAPGGCLAFHDIVTDFKTRCGRQTGTTTGGVPVFWSELRAATDQAEQIVESPDQDGYGIGWLPWTDSVEFATRAMRRVPGA